MGTAGSGERTEAGILAQLPRLHLSYRLVARTRFGLFTSKPSCRRILVALAFGVYDALGARWMARHDDPPHFAARAALDAVDMMLWAGVEDEAFDHVIMISNVTSAEAGARFGFLGLIVPALHGASIIVGRGLRGKRTPLYPLIWPVVSVGAGMTLALYENRRLTRLRAANDLEVTGRRERARLGGQHSIAMGVDPIVDLLVRTTPMLADPDRPLQDPIHAWKARLAEHARSEATYLADAARTWSTNHNNATPILADTVEMWVGEGGDQVLLTRRQVDALVVALDTMRLSGRVDLATELGGRGHVTGRSIAIVVNGSPINLPAESVVAAAPLDPAPLAVALMVPWLLNQSNPAYEYAPLSRTVPGSVAALVAAAALFRRDAQGRDGIHVQALMCALLIALIDTVLATPAMRNDVALNGFQGHPFVSSLYAPTALASLYWRELRPFERSIVIAGVTTCAAVGLCVRPWPSRLRDLISLSSELAVTIGAARGWAEILSKQAELVATEVEQQAQGAEVEGFEEGRHQVIDMVGDALQIARTRLVDMGENPEPRKVTLIRGRLDELDSRLAGLIRVTPESRLDQ